jgi:hypothetical protein
MDLMPWYTTYESTESGSDIPTHPWYLPYLQNAICYPCDFCPLSSSVSNVLRYGRCPGNLLRSDSVVHPHGSIASRLGAHEARACHKHCPTPDLSPTMRYFDKTTTPVHSFWTSAHILYLHSLRIPIRSPNPLYCHVRHDISKRTFATTPHPVCASNMDH